MRSIVFALLALVTFTSCMPTQPAIAQAPPEAAQAIGEPTYESLSSFRKQALKMAQEEVAAGRMPRTQLFALRIATMNKGNLERMHQAVAEQVLADGKAASYSAIDWSKLGEILKEMLPVILQLLKLFASDQASLNQPMSDLAIVDGQHFWLAA